MKTPQDGGPAFPTQDLIYPNGQMKYGQDGMTLRDWFAGMALQGHLSIPLLSAIGDEKISKEDVVGACYEWADTMLKHRNEK